MIRLGESGRPFLDYLLYNACESGYRDIVLVVAAQDDTITQYYRAAPESSQLEGLNISFAEQSIPAGRSKPLGTSDALLQALYSRRDWAGTQFTMCNGDNLYSPHALTLMRRSGFNNALADYDRSALMFKRERIEAFAVTEKDDEGFLLNIIEKPSKEDILKATGVDGRIGVSMNLFRFEYDMVLPFLERTPISATSSEKELPTTVVAMVRKFPRSVFAHPIAEHVPDLTSPDDISRVQRYLVHGRKD